MDDQERLLKLKRRCLSLSLEDRESLIQDLTASLSWGEPDKRLVELTEQMNAIVGRDIRTRCRDNDLVMARAIFFFVANKEGFTQASIARFMKMNHSTICHHIHLVSDAIAAPKLWADYYALFETYIKEIA